jgi:hypothetical protein
MFKLNLSQSGVFKTILKKEGFGSRSGSSKQSRNQFTTLPASVVHQRKVNRPEEHLEGILLLHLQSEQEITNMKFLEGWVW